MPAGTAIAWVLTLPASFDEVARELTIQAAARAYFSVDAAALTLIDSSGFLLLFSRRFTVTPEGFHGLSGQLFVVKKLDTHPYFRTKHDSEGIVRKECSRPWRVYRPGMARVTFVLVRDLHIAVGCASGGPAPQPLRA